MALFFNPRVAFIAVLERDIRIPESVNGGGVGVGVLAGNCP